MMQSILLVEDEAKVASFLEEGLAEEGYRVHWVRAGRQALATLDEESFDLVLLDVGLPDLSGLQVCRELRQNNQSIAVLMLTALDAVEDRVTGLRAGADDYLPKPFAFEELLARIEALLRRRADPPEPSLLNDGALELDCGERSCRCHGRSVALTRKEFDLLAYFLARRGRVLSREEIHRNVWGHDFERGTNLIDVYVGYVRRKLQAAGCEGHIATVRGIGYRYVQTDSNP